MTEVAPPTHWAGITLHRALPSVLSILAPGALVYLPWRVRRAQRAAALLQETEERWKFALEGAGDGVRDAFVTTGRTQYSPRWQSMLGHEEHEIGDAADEWASRIHPDDLPRVRQLNDACVAGATDEFVCELRMRTKDGRWIWVLDRARVVARTPSGRARRMIGTHTDVTERKYDEVRKAARTTVHDAGRGR